jgi:two-component system sensor histidine kinase VanS
MALCCGITYFSILHFAPYIYSYTLSDVEWVAAELAQELSRTEKEETAVYFSMANETLSENYDEEYLLHLFHSSGAEVRYTDVTAAVGKHIDDYSRQETTEHFAFSFIGDDSPYTLLLSKNTEKESQVIEGLYKAVPSLAVIILVTSVLIAIFYAGYMTAPIKKISRISKQMANMDFSGQCPVDRSDEIGVLSSSLNELSSKLNATLSDLQAANQKLQADIEKERHLEQQRIAFFSAASHELKTPITIVKGQLQGMLYQVGRYKDRETYLAQSLEVIDTLEKMVQEALTLSRIEAPEYSYIPLRLDFTQLVRQRLSAFEDLLVQKELSANIDLSVDVYVDGDPDLLQKVVDNLLGNAVTYSPPGHSLYINLSGAGGKMDFKIENTGVHIPEADIPKLFEPFYRVEQSRNRQTGGSGLGLSIVKTILDLHGADIRIQNTKDGVVVDVTL